MLLAPSGSCLGDTAQQHQCVTQVGLMEEMNEVPERSISPPTPQNAIDCPSSSLVLCAPHSLHRGDRHLAQCCEWQHLNLLLGMALSVLQHPKWH